MLKGLFYLSSYRSILKHLKIVFTLVDLYIKYNYK